MHHPVRRRKRRSHGVCSSNNFNSIGVRAVDVVRGHNGFGFTISGQQPCLLSCIVAGSPAEAAGLRPGHALVAVNGRSVAKLPHDTVVRLIGSCAGTLRLHVAENYYPHSSDSDVEDVDAYLPRRPAQGRAARVVRDLHTGAMFVEKSIPACSPPLQLPPRGAQNPPPPPPPSRIQPSDFRAVVGYLGTIELPKVLLPGSKLAVIRSCVRRMRAEKRVHTTVMLIVRKEQSVILADSLGTILAEFVAERVAFCGACADDKRFFGLVTSVTSVDDDDDDVSAACGGSSCHVFMVDPSVHPHPAHEQRAAAFRIVCTASGEGCAEFPALADPILRAVAALYNPASPPPPPPRSNTSSCPSSNSDSGIGFREEPALVEESTAQERLTVRAMPDPPCVAVLQQQQLKLSPKVYGLPVAQSLEDLPPAAAALEPSGDESMSSLEHHQHWGSLQDLRTMPVRHPHQAQPSGRRRKHTTHHQHPPSSSHSSISAANSMPPPQLVASASLSQPMLASLSVPSSVPSPQPSDDETDGNKEADSRSGGTCRSHSEGGNSEAEPGRGGPNSCFDSFERLLDDPNGMHAFAEFLKKEFSHENIYFWVACEKYRRLPEVAARKAQARSIFQRHLGPGAPEPVNVDSQARQAAREGLDEAKPDLFVSSQKQIFNLMKFDSYPRFLKSDGRDEPGPMLELDPDLLLHAADEPNPGKLKKSRSDAEERRRKSLLPWHRGKSGGGPRTRSKSRDREASSTGVPEAVDSASSVRSELTGSRSSLASSDLALIQRGSSSRQSLSSGEAAELCRVHLPDGATTVLATQRDETAKQLVSRLLEKRGLQYSSFELFLAGTGKPVPLGEDASVVLGGQEVRVEQRVVFRLDLPSRKTVGVKAKAGRTLAEVLRPILHKYGYRLDNTTITLLCDPEPLDPCLLITAVENQRLQATVTGPDGWRDRCKQQQQQSGGGATLDEITNRVFEELLQGKTEDSSGPQSRPLSDHGSIRSEDWSSEHSSGIFGRFLRRDSAFLDKTRESRSKGKKCVPQQQQQVSKHASLDLDSPLLGSQPALAVGPTVTAAQAQAAAAKAKWKLRPQAHGRSESDELYEGLKRAQRRMDDQRGTEINFELPDFLKDKENAPQQRRLKKGRLTDMDVSLPLLGGGDGIDLSVTEGILPSPGQAEAYFSNHLRCSLSGEELAAPPAPPQRHNNAPPPLPPKPKTFPALPRSKWNPSAGFSSASEEDSGNNNTRPAAQSTTSFV